MTIKLAKYPDSGVEVVLRALSDMDFGTDKSALGGSGEQEISEPIAVYTLDLESATSGELPKDLVPTAFRYMMFTESNVSAADITVKDGGSEAGEFNRITTGPLVERFNKALEYVDEKYADADTEFEIRALEIPSINEAAIWLISDLANVFVPYLDKDRLKGKEISENEEFLAEMAEHASQIQRDSSN